MMKSLLLLLVVFSSGCSTTGYTDIGEPHHASGSELETIEVVKDHILESLRPLSKKHDITLIMAALTRAYWHIGSYMFDVTRGTDKELVVRAELINMLDHVKEKLQRHMDGKEPI